MRDRVKQNMTMSAKKKTKIKVTGIRGKNEKTDSLRKREFIVRSKEVWKQIENRGGNAALRINLWRIVKDLHVASHVMKASCVSAGKGR